MIWLVVLTILKNISQMGLLFPIYGKITNVPNHQPVMLLNSKQSHAPQSLVYFSNEIIFCVIMITYPITYPIILPEYLSHGISHHYPIKNLYISDDHPIIIPLSNQTRYHLIWIDGMLVG